MSEQDQIRLVAMSEAEAQIIYSHNEFIHERWENGITEEERRRLLDYVRGWVAQYPPKDLSPEARLDDRIAAKLLAKEDSAP